MIVKLLFQYCILIALLMTSGCALNFETKHGSTNSKTAVIKEGQSFEEVTEVLGQESLASNNSDAIYYISSDARHAYFLRPSTINYKIMRVDFSNKKVSKITNYEHNMKYNSAFFNKLKSQDKIKIEDFFKEAIGTSSFKSN